MKDLLFNLDSIEVSYGDNVLNSIVQIDERINDLDVSLTAQDTINDFEKSALADRLNRLLELNFKIRAELDKQAQILNDFKVDLLPGQAPHHFLKQNLI